jgi:hypothetical protein
MAKKKVERPPSELSGKRRLFRCVKNCMSPITPGGKPRLFKVGFELRMPSLWEHPFFEVVDESEGWSDEEREAQLHADLAAEAMAKGAKDPKLWSIEQLNHFLSMKGGTVRPQDIPQLDAEAGMAGKSRTE